MTHQTVSFPNEHFAGCGEVTCVDRVEIDVTAHGFSHLIASIPIDGYISSFVFNYCQIFSVYPIKLFAFS